MTALPTFEPSAALRNPHVQTVVASMFRRVAAPRYSRERLELPDGDFLDLDHVTVEGSPAQVLVLHGLAGSAQSPYVCGVVHELQRAGLSSTVLNFRGCSGTPNRLARAYHSGETGDLIRVAEGLRARRRGVPLVAVGFSLGANALLLHLGQTGDSAVVDAAVGVCAPLDLALCSDWLDRGVAGVYRDHLIRALKAGVRQKRALLQPVIDVEHALRARTFFEFDDRVTAPLHGFAGAADYYARCSSRPALPGIARPTTILQAYDDPFMPPTVLPDANGVSASTRLVVSPTGGHVGFVASRRAPGGRWWLDGFCVAAVQAHVRTLTGAKIGEALA